MEQAPEPPDVRSSTSILRAFVRALKYELPVFPVPFRLRVSMRRYQPATEYGLAAALFPVVGCLHGLLTLLIARGAASVWPAPLPALLALFALFLFEVGDFDGFLDSCDALPVKRKREEVLKIFKDPGMGVFAGLGLAFVVSGHLACVVLIPPEKLLVILFVLPVISRWAKVIVIFRASPAYEKSSARPFIEGLGWWLFALSIPPGLAAALFAFGPTRGAIVLAATVTVALGCRRLCVARTGGVVGDAMGAAGLLASLALLLVAVAR